MSRGKTCPIEFDEAEPIVGLIKGDMFRGVGNVGLDQDSGIILGVDGKGVAIVGLTMFLNVLFDKPLLVCLLYTSPSPRDRQKSRMPSSA